MSSQLGISNTHVDGREKERGERERGSRIAAGPAYLHDAGCIYIIYGKAKKEKGKNSASPKTPQTNMLLYLSIGYNVLDLAGPCFCCPCRCSDHWNWRNNSLASSLEIAAVHRRVGLRWQQPSASSRRPPSPRCPCASNGSNSVGKCSLCGCCQCLVNLSNQMLRSLYVPNCISSSTVALLSILAIKRVWGGGGYSELCPWPRRPLLGGCRLPAACSAGCRADLRGCGRRGRRGPGAALNLHPRGQMFPLDLLSSAIGTRS